MRRVNSIFKLLWAFAMLALPAPVLLSTTLAQGGPKAPPVSPATVTFRDLPSDKIRSDGLGPYTGGGDNGQINCFLRSYEKNQNLVLGLSGTGRTLILDCTDTIGPQNAPSGIGQGGAMVVNNIASMPVTTAKITTAQFNTDDVVKPIGFFKWTGVIPSTWVYVVRDTQVHWTISTKGPLSGAGDVSVLSSSKGVVLGYYHMPFGVTVDCPNCP